MYKVISLFSGCGGSSLGYKLAGLKVLASVEFIDFQAENYRLNFPDTKVYEKDIRTLNPLDILNDLNLGVGELDVLDGSPPCSSFSTCGSKEKGWSKVKKYSNRKQRTDDLFFEYIRFLREIKPKVFVAENVSGLVKGTAKGYFIEILKKLKDSGYNVKAKVLNAKYYNVPQARQRLIFIGVRNDIGIEPTYPIPNRNLIPLREAFKNITNSEKDLSDASCRKYAIYNELVKLKEYGRSLKRFNLSKESKDKPCRTLVASTSSISAASVCHWDNRKFTVNECKAIQTFPQDFILTGYWSNQIEAIGRAVPPKLMQAIAEHIKTEILGATKELKG